MSTSRDDLTVRVARLQIKQGIEPDKEALGHLLAKQIGADRFLVGGKEMSGDELLAATQEEYDKAHEFDDLYAELGLTEPTHGLDLHKAAMELLASRGNHAPTYDEYANATAEVSS